MYHTRRAPRRRAHATGLGVPRHSLRRAAGRAAAPAPAGAGSTLDGNAKRGAFRRVRSAGGRRQLAGAPLHRRRTGRAQRGLPLPERLDASARRGAATGDGLHPRRRIPDGLRKHAALRRVAPLRAGRSGRGHAQLPARRTRLARSARAASECRRGPRESRTARPDRGAGLGAREHRGARRRSRVRDGLRRVGGRDEHRHVARHEGRARAVPARDPAERRGP